MTRPRTIWRTLVLLLLAAVLASFVAQPRDQDPEPKTAIWPRSGEYVGADACRECHRDEASTITHGVHAAVVESPLTMQCETCHGPGRAHADDPDGPRIKITHPQKLTTAGQARLCSRCHAAESRGHGGGGLEGLMTAGFGCTDCHGVHEKRTEAPHAEVRFRSRAATLAVAEPTSAADCTRCHPLQSRSLSATKHRELATDEPKGGCATCHGNGSLHADSFGIARLISRPDRATDGVLTCTRCHSDVDPVLAHWPNEDAPFLRGTLTCFDCHRVHHETPPPVVPEQTKTDAAPTNALCARCHQPAFARHIGTDTVHAPLAELSRDAVTGCASCHRGGVEHALAGGRKDLVESLRDANRSVQESICLPCHGDRPALQGLHAGSHARNEVSCTGCHSPSPERLAVQDDAERNCAHCHAGVAAAFNLPNRHPVDDAHRMHCSSCHEPHSARPRLRDPALREGRCVECHRAYRGPFAFAHQASRIDGCVACHEPHGSSNKRMLHETSTQQNCIACHGDYPTFHDQTPGSVFTNCLNCHTQVHGSNHSRYLLR